MSEYKIGWKVVSVHKSQLRSAIGSHRCKLYGIGKTTKRTRGWGSLAVFESFMDAREFYRCYNKTQHHTQRNKTVLLIFRCRYLPTEGQTTSLCLYYKSMRDSTIVRFYMEAPLGTDYADEVTLLEDVTIAGWISI